MSRTIDQQCGSAMAVFFHASIFSVIFLFILPLIVSESRKQEF